MRISNKAKSTRRSLALLVALSLSLGSLATSSSMATAAIVANTKAAATVPTPATAAASTSASASSASDSSSSASLAISRPTAVAGALSATVSYKAPKGASGLTYRVRYSSNKGKAWNIYGPTTSALSITVSGLAAGTSYIFQVSAKKTTAWGAWSEDSNAVKPTAGGTPTSFSLSASASAGGTISPSGITTVASGGSQTYSINPNGGFQISSVQVDGTSVGAVSSYTFSNVTANHSILASFTAITYSIVASGGAHGSITPSGTTPVVSGTSQSYTITPATGYHVADVLVDGASVGAVGSYTFNSVSAAHTIAASFAINTYAITSSVDFGSGTISPSGTTSVDYGANQTFSISPATGYRIADVTVDSASVGTPSSYTFSNVTGPHAISVTFAVITYDITASVETGSGTISPSGTTAVAEGQDKTYTISPAPGYKIDTLKIDGTTVSNTNSYTFSNVSAAHSIAVKFVVDSFTITASLDSANGSISDVGDSTVSGTGEKTYTITPSAGYVIDVLKIDGTTVSNTTSYTFSNVTENHTISVSFILGSYTLSAAVDGGQGTISDAGDSSVAGNSNKTYTITPASGYILNAIYVDGVLVDNASSYTFDTVTDDHEILVYFVEGFNITATATGPGSTSANGVVGVASGSNKTYTFTPNANSFVADVLIDGVSIGAYYTYTFTNVIQAHTVEVKFEALSYQIYGSVDYGNGSIDPQGFTTVWNGDDQTYTFAADAGWFVDNVNVDGEDLGSLDSYTFSNVKSTHDIYVQFAESQNYTISALVDTGIGSITDEGDVTVSSNQSKTYTITPYPGFVISEIYVDNQLVANTTSYTFSHVRANHSILVRFLVGYTITANSSGPGSVSSAGSTSVIAGTSKKYTFTPASGSFVASVLIDGVSIGAYSEYTFTDLGADHTVEVTFESFTYGIYSDVDYGNGDLSRWGWKTVYNGDDQTYYITPDDGWYVYEVYVDDEPVGGVTEYTFTNVKAQHSLIVVFEEIRDYTITSSVDYGNGSITPSGETAVQVTTSQTYDFAAATGWHVVDVVIDGQSHGALDTYTFRNVRRDHTIYVSFAENVAVGFTITYDANPGQSGTTSTSHTQTDLDIVSIEANDYVADNGFHFYGWNTEPDGSGAYYFAGSDYELIADVILYAIWTEGVSITYDANQPMSGTTSTSHTQTGTGIVLIEANDYVAANNATFYGWNTQANGKGTYYFEGDQFDLSENLMLFAIWTFDVTVTVGWLDSGNFGSPALLFKHQDVSDPTQYVYERLNMYDSRTFAVLAGADGVFQVYITGFWVEDANQQYAGDHIAFLTGLSSVVPSVIMPAFFVLDNVEAEGLYMFLGSATQNASLIFSLQIA